MFFIPAKYSAESILSNIPPWPGKNFPVSFIFSNLLKYETIRSPIWHANEKIKAKKKYLILKIKLKSPGNN